MALPHPHPDRPAALGRWTEPRHVPSPPPADLVAAPLRATGHPAVSVLLPTTPAGVMSEPDRGVLRGLLDRLRAVMGDRAALLCAQGYLLGRPSLEPPWRSTTSTRWPLRRIMMGPEPEATAVPARATAVPSRATATTPSTQPAVDPRRVLAAPGLHPARAEDPTRKCA